MTWSALRRGVAFTLWAAAAAVAGILIVYHGGIDSGFYYDDYHFLRPLRSLEYRRLWFGSWDPTGIERPFFRPLTATIFGFRFWLFGLNSQALHAVSLAGHTACAVMLAWFLRREGIASAVALSGAWIYAIHPLFPYAQTSWVTNQMHLMESLLVLAGLLAWQSVRDRPPSWWLLLIPIAVAAFLVKEDAVMLLPVLVALTMARWRFADGPLGARMFVVGAGAIGVLAGLLAFRQQRLGQLGGYAVPTFEQAQINFWKGIDAALLLWPTRTPWQAVASVVAIAAVAIALVVGRRHLNMLVAAAALAFVAALSFTLPSFRLEIQYPLVTWQGVASGIALGAIAVGLGVAVRRNDLRALYIMSAGLIITLGFNAPFALVSKREQYHLLALGAVVLLSGAAAALHAVATHRRAAMSVAAVVTLPFAFLARSQAADFLPCAPAVVDADQAAGTWWVVPGEVKAWLVRKAQACRDGAEPSRLTDVPVATWGLHGEEREPSGETFRWTSDQGVMLVARRTSSLALAIRRPDATPANPVSVRIRGGKALTSVVLTSHSWQYVTVTFDSGILTALRSAHRIDIDVTRWFVPAVLDPKSPDLRRFGVQVKVVKL
jgi:hypothetical protein